MADHKRRTGYTGVYNYSRQYYQKELKNLNNNYIIPYEQYKDFYKKLEVIIKKLDEVKTSTQDAKKNLADWLTIDGEPIAANGAAKSVRKINDIVAEITSLMGYVNNRMEKKSKYNGKDIYSYRRELNRKIANAKVYKEGYTGD